MKAEVKQFGRGKNAPDTRERCGRLDLRAQDENDAAFLAMLYRAIWCIGAKADSRALLCDALMASMDPPIKGFEPES